ncbi:hypothetical protein BCR33DRAFT_713392 [Rhizoclosmatium globosum]|uniref:Glycosyltransferase 61 catalytic domain-containing protein n=1 Tax=Rhizoclosmatium globosum TaxID=329046 RepID=A0A1Y2CRZ6_9FUNG|nr:hypothetical protein BCR33DRAFT_713392 [Rhizoclosmatium globosum]|eukprot:ORY49772.1 hypothetical protein BCR33DRAFT_713392 [Rhizoclosmatium globosum]
MFGTPSSPLPQSSIRAEPSLRNVRQQRRLVLGLVGFLLTITGLVWWMRSGRSDNVPSNTPTATLSKLPSKLKPSTPNPNPDPYQSSSSPSTRLRLASPLRKGKLPKTPEHSHFSCLGNDNSIEGFRERICVFSNVCYRYNEDKWIYHSKKLVNPDNPNQFKDPTTLFDSKYGERTSFIEGDHGFVALHQTTDWWVNRENTWGPEIEFSSLPIHTSPANTLTLSPLHSVFAFWADDDNLGHLLWEEMATLFYSMHRMSVTTDSLVAMHYPEPLPERKLALKFRNAFFPAISSHPPVNLREYLHTKISESHISASQNPTVCFENLLVGGNMRRFLHPYAWHNHGHEPLFKSLRSKILLHHSINPDETPTTHHILITNKTETNFKGDNSVHGSRKRAIANLDTLVAFLKERYGHSAKITTIEWQKHSIKEQLDIIHSATLFITPPGGVSMLLPFLPNGATAIVIDYLENEPNNLWGTPHGESISMEAPFWNHWPHVRKLYYQIRSAEDLVSDSEKPLEEVSWREGVSYVLDMARVGALVDQAFDDMEN